MNTQKFVAIFLFGCLTLMRGATAASAEDAVRPDWNKRLASQYMDERAQTWFAFGGADRGEGTAKISCISCHSVAPYALARPALRKLTGATEPTTLEAKLLKQTKQRVEHWRELDSETYRLFYDFSEQKKKESWGTEAVLNALVLAFDDHYEARAAPGQSTVTAMANLWQKQQLDGGEKGSWEWLDFGLAPWETKEARYFGATLAALAIGTAPGYFKPGTDAELDKKVDLLRGYLRGQLATQNLNNRIWMLWASAKVAGLLSKEEQKNVIDAVLQKQQTDGGWSLSSLGTRAPTKDFTPDATSDGYATGLILHVLQEARMPKTDAKIAAGLSWLRSHQAASGAWRANSVNKKRDPATHVGKFMTDAATAYAVLALSH